MSGPGGLFLSIVLRPERTRPLQLLPLLVSVAAAEAIRELSGDDVRLHWPNDLFIGDRKLGGVLCEGGFKGSEPDAFVVGIGINVNQRRTDFPAELRERAASLSADTISPIDVCTAIVSRIERWWDGRDEARVIARYRELADGLYGERVRVEPRDGLSFTATTAGIEDDGGLKVTLDEGGTRGLYAEAVTRLQRDTVADDSLTDVVPDSYYGRVESYFIERRGSPLFITPAEWFLVAQWEEQGIPLQVIQDAIDRVLDRPRKSSRPLKLTYCRQAVQSEFRRFREVRLGAREVPEASPLDSVGHLQALAAAVAPSDPDVARAVEALAASIGSAGGTSEARIEEELEKLDETMIDTAERELDAEQKSKLEAEAQRSLASYRERMPEKVYLSAVKSAYRKRLRAARSLPLLSLYDR